MELTAKEISEKYNGCARWYDLVGKLSRASGKVLEIAAGTGKNFAHYPAGCQITAVDLSEGMLAVARQRADELSLTINFALMNAQNLGFPNACFDAVVSSLSTCTFPDPVTALKEMARVCRPDGKILLLEHGRSDREWLGRFQDRYADQFAKPVGCHWNRELLALAKSARFKIIGSRRNFFGIFHQIEAQPGAM